MPGTTIVVTSFYICPTNKKKVGGCKTIVLSEDSLLFRFAPLKLWVLQSQKLWSSFLLED